MTGNYSSLQDPNLFQVGEDISSSMNSRHHDNGFDGLRIWMILEPGSDAECVSYSLAMG